MLWRMLEMVAPRALVFRPLVKGNEALGTRLIAARNIRMSLRDKRIAFSKESYGISEDNRARTKYVIRDKDLPTELADPGPAKNIECK